MITNELKALLQLAIAEETCGMPVVSYPKPAANNPQFATTTLQPVTTGLQQGPANSDTTPNNNNIPNWWWLVAAAAIAYAVSK